MKLGQGAAPDLLSVSLSATDYIGHAVGNEGVEMCIQMAEVDAAIGKLLAHLDARGIDYAVVLSADHGGLDAPERSNQQALPAAVRVDDALRPDRLAKAVTARTGISASQGPLLYADGASGDFYVNRGLSAQEKDRVIDALVSIARAHPQVAAVYTNGELARMPMPTANAPSTFFCESSRNTARDRSTPVRSSSVS